MSLNSLMQHGLPLNRKERFYTGTVLPMIALAEQGGLFSRLTRLIDGYEEQPVDWSAASANVQFFTEYSFVESAFGAGRDRFPTLPTSKETPDVMILVTGARTSLIAIEAKMFHNPLAEDIDRQMRAQAVILDFLQPALEIDVIHHMTLLPEKLARNIGPISWPVLTWEQIYAAFADGCEEDYWLALLHLALEQYDDLVARGSMATFGANSERKMSGGDILRLHEAGVGPNVMGRNRGLGGPELAEDVRTGRWRAQMYETRSDGEIRNRNWFAVQEFAALIRTASGSV